MLATRAARASRSSNAFPTFPNSRFRSWLTTRSSCSSAPSVPQAFSHLRFIRAISFRPIARPFSSMAGPLSREYCERSRTRLNAPLQADGAAREILPLSSGPLTPQAIWAALNHFMPEGSIVSDEAGMSSRGRRGHERRRAARLVEPDWRLDWTSFVRRSWCCRCSPRLQGVCHAGGRRRPVYASGTVDTGAREARRRQCDLQQRPVRHSRLRSQTTRHQPRCEGRIALRSRIAVHRLGLTLTRVRCSGNSSLDSEEFNSVLRDAIEHPRTMSHRSKVGAPPEQKEIAELAPILIEHPGSTS